jgi:hypothetical protein
MNTNFMNTNCYILKFSRFHIFVTLVSYEVVLLLMVFPVLFLAA